MKYDGSFNVEADAVNKIVEIISNLQKLFHMLFEFFI